METRIPGAREFGVFVYPLEKFASLWPRLHARGTSSPLRIAIVGNGTAAMELALAVRQRLQNSAITLVMEGLADSLHSPLVQRLVLALKHQRITVLQEHVRAISRHAVALGCGAQLACDVPLMALDNQSPAWLLRSALSLRPDQRVDTDIYERSSSHPQVFAADAHSTSLTYNVAATIAGRALEAPRKDAQALRLLFGGAQHAVLGWRGYTMQGRAVQWLKQWSDRRQLAQWT